MNQNSSSGRLQRENLASCDKLAGDIMILATQYPIISTDATIKEAVDKLMNSYDGYISNKRLIYTVPRSMLVFDNEGAFAGIISVRNMIRAMTPNTSSRTDPEHEFWDSSRDLAKKRVQDVMQKSVTKVHVQTKLTEVAQLMALRNTRRVVVVDDNNEVIGIVREQELFFEMANIIL